MKQKKSSPEQASVQNNEIRFNKRPFKFTDKQNAVIKKITDPESQITFIKGPAGVSKTYLGVYSAIRMMQDNPESSLIYLRSVVESSDRSMGFLPGSAQEKTLPFMEILEDKLSEIVTPSDKISLMKSERITSAPINFLRGKNWLDGTIIILDEAQNVSFQEFLTILTRIGEGAKMIVLFDPDQSDIRYSGANRVFQMFCDPESEQEGISCFEFDEDDVVRSRIVKFILKKFALNR